MKKGFLLIAVMFLTMQACIVPYADKQFIGFDPQSKSERVKQEFMGPVLILKIPTGDGPGVAKAIRDLAKLNSCEDLKNIDVEYFENYYYLIGFPKIVVQADCVKKGKQVEEKK